MTNPNGVLLDSNNNIVSVVYGWGGTPPVGQTFVAMPSLAGIAPQQVLPPLQQAAAVGFASGLVLTSTGTPSLNGTYAIDNVTCDHMQAEMIALLNSGGTAFCDGTTAVAWPDVSGAAHTFNTVQFKAFALAASAYVAALYKVQNGTLTTVPPNTAIIA